VVSSSARTPQPAAGRLDRIYEAEQNVADKHREFQGQQFEFLHPENLVSNLTPGFPNLGAPIALILGALAVGSEYGWTTFKTVLTQRPGRLGLYFGKLLALGIVLALLVVLIFAAGAASGYVVGGLEDAPVGWPAAGELARALGAGGLILAIWAALGVLLATLLRSTALSIGIGLVYYFVLETSIFNLLFQNKAFREAREFFPGQNSSFLANSFSGQAQGGFVPPEPPVEVSQAALVPLAYAAAFVLLPAFVFSRRDVT
jgi:ABC-2 type transport system permease protein